jgi:hypothetical protein
VFVSAMPTVAGAAAPAASSMAKAILFYSWEQGQPTGFGRYANTPLSCYKVEDSTVNDAWAIYKTVSKAKPCVPLGSWIAHRTGGHWTLLGDGLFKAQPLSRPRFQG